MKQHDPTPSSMRAGLLLVTALLSSCAAETPRDNGKVAPAEATHITREEIELVNAAPGTDRNVRVVDIGHENFAIGVVHRGKTQNGVELDRARNRSAEPKSSCGQPAANVPSDGLSGGITHDAQTEGYYILSGSGRMFTGGHLTNGRHHDLAELNGPTCIGTAHGYTMHDVYVGDVVIIPAGVVHGWAEVPDHVDYLAFRPSPGILAAGWTHPVIRPRAPE
jgi:mannose-6-phosphate isomerase-like protein (cupin superfamily)